MPDFVIKPLHFRKIRQARNDVTDARVSINRTSLERVPNINKRQFSPEVFKSPRSTSYVFGLKRWDLHLEAKTFMLWRYRQERRSILSGWRRCLLGLNSGHGHEKQSDKAHHMNPPVTGIRAQIPRGRTGGPVVARKCRYRKLAFLPLGRKTRKPRMCVGRNRDQPWSYRYCRISHRWGPARLPPDRRPLGGLPTKPA